MSVLHSTQLTCTRITVNVGEYGWDRGGVPYSTRPAVLMRYALMGNPAHLASFDGLG